MAKRDFESEIDALKKEVKSLTRQLKQTSNHVSGEVAEKAEDYVGEARDYYDKLADTAKERWDELQTETKATASKIDRYAKEKPWHVAGMAVAAGFLAAMLASNRRDR